MKKSFRVGFAHGVTGRENKCPFRWYWAQRWYEFGYSLGRQKNQQALTIQSKAETHGQ